MRKLMRANLVRIRRDKVLWGGFAVMVLFCDVACVNQYRMMIKMNSTFILDNFVFGGSILIGIVLSIFCSLHTGTEYSDGTMRNKVVVGHKRRDIYFSNSICCVLAGVFLMFATVGATFVIGLPLFGGLEMGMGNFFLLFAEGALSCAAYVSLFQLVGMLSTGKAQTAIINILLGFFLLFLAIGLYQSLMQPEMMEQAQITANGQMTLVLTENPGYLTGIKREVYQFLFDFLPGGQLYQIMNRTVLHPYRLPVYSLIVIAVSHAAGVYFFARKDLK